MSEQNVQAMRRLYDAFNSGDFETIEQGFSRSLVWNEAENSLYCDGNPYRSFDAIRDGVFFPARRDNDNFRVEIERIFDAFDDHVICVGRYRGRNKETGKEVSTQFCHVMHVDKNKKLDFFQEFADTFHEAETAGRLQPVEKVRIPQPAM